MRRRSPLVPRGFPGVTRPVSCRHRTRTSAGDAPLATAPPPEKPVSDEHTELEIRTPAGGEPPPTRPRRRNRRRLGRRAQLSARQLAVIGAPSGAGACGVGQERAPSALRAAGLIEALGGVGLEVSDLGDSPVVPWRPDRARPRAQNLEAVLDVVRTTATRVADALRDGDRRVLVLGGDCTVGIGTIAGVRATRDGIAVAYFDLHSDLNTPASATDGALDWMAPRPSVPVRTTRTQNSGSTVGTSTAV